MPPGEAPTADPRLLLEIASLKTAVESIAERLIQLHAVVGAQLVRRPTKPCAECEYRKTLDDAAPRFVVYKDQKVRLTPVRAALLRSIMVRRGRVALWGSIEYELYEAEHGRPWSRDEHTSGKGTIQAHLVALRKELAHLPINIITERGLGVRCEHDAKLKLVLQ